MTDPNIISHAQNQIAQNDISHNALQVLGCLQEAGYQAFLVGGCVRDLLLGYQPKDFDIATNAFPEDVKRLFTNSRLIGRRFRLAHIIFGQEIIEVATFRADIPDSKKTFPCVKKQSKNKDLIIRDNVYGSLEEDVWRRDFTVNALYLDVQDFSIIDYASGYNDLQNKLLRFIGEPERRIREDPVRLLRAVRFAAKLDFEIEAQAEQLLYHNGELLDDIPSARLYEETIKSFHSGHALKCFRLLNQFNLFTHIFPEAVESMHSKNDVSAHHFIEQALTNTDQRIRENKSVNPAFLFACFLWYPIRIRAGKRFDQGAPPVYLIAKLASKVLSRQVKAITIPRRISHMMRDIWSFQPRLERSSGKNALRLLSHRSFRAAYDFLCLRAESGEEEFGRSKWWTKIQELPFPEQKQMAFAIRQKQAVKKQPD